MEPALKRQCVESKTASPVMAVSEVVSPCHNICAFVRLALGNVPHATKAQKKRLIDGVRNLVQESVLQWAPPLKCWILDVPVDPMTYTFGFLDLVDVAKCQETCKRMQLATRSAFIIMCKAPVLDPKLPTFSAHKAYLQGLCQQFVIKDKTKAFEAYEAASKPGPQYHKSTFRLGMCYFYGIGTKHDRKKALQLFENVSAVNQEAKLMFALANLYDDDNAKSNAAREAIKDVIHEAKQPYSSNMLCAMGTYHHSKQEYKLDREYSLHASKLGNPIASWRIGARCEKSSRASIRKNALEFHTRAIQGGYGRAMFSLADLYESGTIVPQNNDRALELYRLSVDAGENDGLVEMGRIHFAGLLGVAVDYPKAQRFWQRAWVSNRCGYAAHHLGLCHRDGKTSKGTPEITKAFTWFMRSAERSDRDGIFHLAVCYERGLGVQQSNQRAFTRYLQAAELKHSIAMFETGNCFEHGFGCVLDKARATEWYQKAAAAGSKDAANVLLGKGPSLDTGKPT